MDSTHKVLAFIGLEALKHVVLLVLYGEHLQMGPMVNADWNEQFYFLRKTLETLDVAFRDRVVNLD